MVVRYIALIFTLLLAACGSGASKGDSEWPTYGRDLDEQRFSPLEQISAANVDRLGLEWSYDMRDGMGVEATPLMVDGVLYAISAWNILYALDAKTGAELWVFDPEVDREFGASSCCGPVSRGVAYADGSLFIATLDGKLIAVDAKTGTQQWSVNTFDGGDWPYVITGAPRIAEDLVLIGNSGADVGARGYVSAYDRNTGKRVWRFYTVPGNPADGPDGEASDDILATATETWNGDFWKQGGGGTVWDSITYDAEMDRIYIGVGNGSPWNQQIRSPGGGDNLFLASIVALDRKSGKYIWHYQVTPGDTWDVTATQSMILADMEFDGKKRRILMQAPKNGFFYVIDRDTGKLLSAKNIVPMAKTADTPMGAPISWAYGVDMATGRPLENPEARFLDGTAVRVHPTGMGAHSWQPMAYHPGLGIAYIPAQDFAATFQHDPDYRPTKNARASGLKASGAVPQDKKIRDIIAKSVNPKLIAWDVKAQKEAWHVPYDYAGNGGVLATAGGIVFQSAANGVFYAYDAAKGTRLWSYDAQATAQGGPISYMIDGEQYIAIAIGNGGLHWIAGGLTSAQKKGPLVGRILIFKLGGKAELARVDSSLAPIPALPVEQFTAGQIGNGAKKYAVFCAACHGFGGISGQVTPDLRRSHAVMNYQSFRSVVKEGVLLPNGMPRFDGELPESDLKDIRAFLIDEARFIKSAEAERIAPK